MAENKTKPTRVSVAAFLKSKATGQQLKDGQELVRLFKEVTGKPAKMWGPGIVGFDTYHYVYESGREGDAPLIAFSPRKPETVLYLAQSRGKELLTAKLGKFKSRGGCIYIKKLAKASVVELRKRYPPKH